MKSRILTCIAALTVLAAPTIVMTPLPTLGGNNRQALDIQQPPTLSGGTVAGGTWINDREQFVHLGVCDENESTGRLTGYCDAIIPPYYSCGSGISNACPKGRRAIKPSLFICGEGLPLHVDDARKCSF